MTDYINFSGAAFWPVMAFAFALQSFMLHVPVLICWGTLLCAFLLLPGYVIAKTK